jgi:hypothetical protein
MTASRGEAGERDETYSMSHISLHLTTSVARPMPDFLPLVFCSKFNHNGGSAPRTWPLWLSACRAASLRRCAPTAVSGGRPAQRGASCISVIMSGGFAENADDGDVAHSASTRQPAADRHEDDWDRARICRRLHPPPTPLLTTALLVLVSVPNPCDAFT